MTQIQNTLALMDGVRKGRFLDQDELLSFLTVHAAFVRRNIGEWKDLTPEYAAQTEGALLRVLAGAKYEDLMKGFCPASE